MKNMLTPIPDDIHTLLKTFAAKSNRKMYEVVTTAIKEYIKEPESTLCEKV